MNMRICSFLILASLTGSLHALSAKAQSNVLFIGGGYAQTCSSAAQSPETPTRYEVTGSRLSISGVDVCTLAINAGDLGPQDMAGSYINRGVLHFSSGNFDAALRDFDAALRLTQRVPQAWTNRGYALVALERWTDSIEAFDRGLEMGSPDADRAHFNRAIAHEELGNLRAAYDDYIRASELNPDWEAPKLELSRFTVH